LHFCFQEWDYELQLLKKDLTDKNGKMKMKKKMNPSPESEAGIAYLKITAVYGEFDSFEDLEKQTKVTSHLGKTETIKSEWVNTISTLIIISAAILFSSSC